MRLGLAGSAMLLALGCGAQSAPVAVPSKPSPSKLDPKSPGAALAAELRRIAAAPSVVSGLSPQAKADLQKMVAALGETERQELARADSVWPKTRPLLHLVAGGDSPDAYFQLATTSRAADELILARQLGGTKTYGDLVASTRAVVQRAAARWLRDRAVDAASPARATAELCDKIDRAAVPLEIVAIRRRARELAAVVQPLSARHAAVAQAATWDLDVAAARAALERARATAKTDSDTSAIAFVDKGLLTAELALRSRGKKLDPDQAVTAARAYLRLGREADASAVLAPHAGTTPSHLGVATVSVMAKTERIVCPGVPAGAPSSLLCAVAWSESASVRAALETVERAWKSRAGRDEQSIGAYIGLAHVVPWLYGTYLAGIGGGDAASAFDQRVGKLVEALEEAVSVAPAFEGIRLFVDTLGGLYEAGKKRKPGERVRLSDELSKQLVERATALSKTQPAHRFTHAGILAVAAASSQDRDVGPVLALLPQEIGADYALPRDVLRIWTAVAERDGATLNEAAGALATLMPTDSVSIDGAKLVLLISEARAAVIGSERELDVLDRIAMQLGGDDVPPDVRLRAAIDRAGALARRGRLGEAEAALEAVISKVSVERGTTEADIAAVAYGYLLVLRARGAKGDERAPYKDKLAKLDETSGGQLPASALVWRDLWLAEIERLTAEDKCGTMKACRDRIAPRKTLTDAELAARVGTTSAKVMQSGVLAAGSLNLTFAFSSEEGLVPVVVFEPRLLAVELPPRTIRNRR